MSLGIVASTLSGADVATASLQKQTAIFGAEVSFHFEKIRTKMEQLMESITILSRRLRSVEDEAIADNLAEKLELLQEEARLILEDFHKVNLQKLNNYQRAQWQLIEQKIEKIKVKLANLR